MAKKPKTVVHEAWRPDFRSPDKLPDIKVVRTDFLLNLVAGFVALALLGFLVYREYEASTLSARLENSQEQVNNLVREDRIHTAASGKFMRDVLRVEEAGKFLAAPVNPGLYLLEIAELQPEQSVLTSVEYGPTPGAPVPGGHGATAVSGNYRLVLRGQMYPSDDKSPTQLIDQFQQAIRDMPYTQGKLKRAELETAQPDQFQDRFNYVIIVEVENGEAKK